MIASYPKD